jgi:hypothetical protein
MHAMSLAARFVLLQQQPVIDFQPPLFFFGQHHEDFNFILF